MVFVCLDYLYLIASFNFFSRRLNSVFSSLSQSVTSPLISNQIATEKTNNYAPMMQTNEDRSTSQDQRAKSPSRFYTNNLFDSIDLNKSLTVPTIPSPRLFQMIDRPPPPPAVCYFFIFILCMICATHAPFIYVLPFFYFILFFRVHILVLKL